jgi:hypothetical protein
VVRRQLLNAWENGAPVFGPPKTAKGARVVELMLAAGVKVEVVSKRLGHSSINITHSIYSHLLRGVGRSAAEAVMGLVPRSTKTPVQLSRDHT